MTVRWAGYAQSRTDRPVKGMLTGPVTMLAWSFVRTDQALADTARQVALAPRDEIADLEAAGIGIIQVDEPALRELRAGSRRDDRGSVTRFAGHRARLPVGQPRRRLKTRGYAETEAALRNLVFAARRLRATLAS